MNVSSTNDDNYMPLLDANDIVTGVNGINIGGFSVNSIMMKAGMPPIQTVQTGQEGGSTKVSDLFGSLAVPNWLLHYENIFNIQNQNHNNSKNDDTDDDEIDDNLHDKLLDIINQHTNANLKSKKQTKKHKKHKKHKNETKKYIKSILL